MRISAEMIADALEGAAVQVETSGVSGIYYAVGYLIGEDEKKGGKSRKRVVKALKKIAFELDRQKWGRA